MTMKRPRGYSSWIRPRRGATGQGGIRWERKLRVWGSLFTVVGGCAEVQPIHSSNESPEPLVYMSFFQAEMTKRSCRVKTEGSPVDSASGAKRHPRNRYTAAGFRCTVFPCERVPRWRGSFAVIPEHPGGNVRADWAGSCSNRNLRESWPIEPKCGHPRDRSANGS